MLSIVISGCTTDKAPKRTYADDKLIGVMIDLYTAEAALKDLSQSDKDSLSIVYRNQIGKIQEVDMSIVERDIEILQSDLETYSRVHLLVKDSIVAIEKKRSKIIKEKKKTISPKDKASAKQNERIKEMLNKPTKGN